MPCAMAEATCLSLAQPVERSLVQALRRRLAADRPHRYQVIPGPRRVGKTTVPYQTVRHTHRARFQELAGIAAIQISSNR